jgi:hypothetical protein
LIGALWLRLVNRDWYFAAFGLLIFAYSWFFNKGFINFSLSLVVYVLGLMLWEIAHRRSTFGFAYQSGMLAIVLFLYFTHGYAVLAWGISLTIFAAHGAQGSWKKWVQQTISLLPAAVLSGISFLAGSTSTTGGGDDELKFPTVQLPQMFLQGSVESFAPGLERWLAVGLLVLLVLGGGRALQSGLSWLRKTQGSMQQVPVRHLFTLLIVLSLLYLVLPVKVPPYEYTKLRIVPFVVLMLLALARIPQWPQLRFGVLALLVTSTVAMQMHIYAVYRQGSAQIQKVLAGIDVFPTGSTLLPVIPGRTNRVGHTRPLLHVWGYYHLEKGGSGPYLHVIGNIHPVQYRKKLPAPREGGNLDPATDAEVLRLYDTVLLVNGDPTSRSVIERDFDLIFANETTQLFRKRLGH